MKIGLMQGRLCEPTDNHIQEFPLNWRYEFDNIKKIGLSHIDWIVTTKSFKNNPIFFEDLTDYPIRSICADNLISENIFNLNFLYENLEPLCEYSQRNKIRSITIPLLEDSSIRDSEKRNELISNMIKIHKNYSDLIFSFEFESEISEILDVVTNVDNFKITYDTGNILSYTKDKNSYNKFLNDLIHKIDCVHLKDRTIDSKTVTPGTGDTNFYEIFRNLKYLKYSGAFTMQTCRETTGQEFHTITKHFEYFKTLF